MSDLHPNPHKGVNPDELIPLYDRMETIAYIKDAFICPLSWNEVFRNEYDDYFPFLDQIWTGILRGKVRGAESQYVGAEFLLFELDDESDEDLRSLYLNVREWKDDSHEELRLMMRRFTDLRYASREDYAKHLPPLGVAWTPNQIDVESRKRGVSLFYRDVPPEEALSAFFRNMSLSLLDDEIAPVEQELLNRLLGDDNARLCFRCTGLIGSSKGVPTDFICYELDATTPILHAYPVTEAEALKINNGAIRVTPELREWEAH